MVTPKFDPAIVAALKEFRRARLDALKAAKGEQAAKFVFEIAGMLLAGRALLGVAKMDTPTAMIFIDILAETNSRHTDLAVAYYLGTPEQEYVEDLMCEAHAYVDAEYAVVREGAAKAA